MNTRTVRELAVYRRMDLGTLEPGLRADVVLHCMRLSLRMTQLTLYQMRGARLWKIIFLKKALRKYDWMYKFYDGYLDGILNLHIGIVRRAKVDT